MDIPACEDYVRVPEVIDKEAILFNVCLDYRVCYIPTPTNMICDLQIRKI